MARYLDKETATPSTALRHLRTYSPRGPSARLQPHLPRSLRNLQRLRHSPLERSNQKHQMEKMRTATRFSRPEIWESLTLLGVRACLVMTRCSLGWRCEESPACGVLVVGIKVYLHVCDTLEQNYGYWRANEMRG